MDRWPSSGRWRATAAGRRSATILSSLQFDEYRRLWCAVTLANSGRWIMTLGAGAFLYHLTASTFWVGASMFAMQGPSLLVSPFAGVAADRFDRRTVLLVGMVLSCVASGALWGLSWSGLASLTLVLGAVVLLGGALSVQGTAANALMPRMVPRSSLPNAVALLGTARQGAEFLGPAIASPLLATYGSPALFGLATACYGLALVQSLRIARHAVTAYRPSSNPFQPLREGLLYITTVPLLGVVVLVVALHCGFTMTYQGLLPAYALGVLGGNDAAYGSLMMMVGLGSLCGTLGLAATSSRRLFDRGYVVTAAGSGLALVLLGMTHEYSVALVVAVAVGATQAAFMAISLTYLQELSIEAYRGRVTSTYSFLAAGMMAAISWSFGGLAMVVAPSFLMIGGGGTFVVIVAIITARSAGFRQLSRFGTAASLAAPDHVTA